MEWSGVSLSSDPVEDVFLMHRVSSSLPLWLASTRLLAIIGVIVLITGLNPVGAALLCVCLTPLGGVVYCNAPVAKFSFSLYSPRKE